jgi:ABC-type Co2+ transport system permease subunit
MALLIGGIVAIAFLFGLLCSISMLSDKPITIFTIKNFTPPLLGIFIGLVRAKALRPIEKLTVKKGLTVSALLGSAPLLLLVFSTMEHFVRTGFLAVFLARRGFVSFYSL